MRSTARLEGLEPERDEPPPIEGALYPRASSDKSVDSTVGPYDPVDLEDPYDLGSYDLGD